MALIEVEGAVKRYGGATALDGADLRVDAGACVALVGESGSGKTTLLRAVNGLTALDEGRVRVRGESVAAMDPVALRRSMGYVQQDGGLIPHWTCLANAALVPSLRGMADAEERGRSALDATGLDSALYGSRYPRQLSGGQRQRVAIARAVAADPDVLLMDEPFGALDAVTRFDAQEAFLALRASAGTTAVLVTHDLAEAMRIATRVAVMRAGRIVLEAASGELAVRAREEAALGRGYAAELLRKSGVGV